MDTLKAIRDYGPLKKERVYKVLRRGRDYYVVSLRGRPFFAYAWVFEK